MGKEYVVIQFIEDENDFEYEPFIVKKDKHFDSKYEKLEELCKNYKTFEDVVDYIYKNFKQIKFNTKIIRV